MNFGRALLRLGDAPNGLRHFQAAVQLAPDSPLALNELAWLLATGPDAALRNGPEAAQLAEQGLCLDGAAGTRCCSTPWRRRMPKPGDFPKPSVRRRRRFPWPAQRPIKPQSSGGKFVGCFQSGRPFRETRSLRIGMDEISRDLLWAGENVQLKSRVKPAN